MIKILDFKNSNPYIIVSKEREINSYGICDFRKTKNITNLNQVKIVTSLKKKREFLPKKFKLDLYYKGEIMRKKKIIEGGYGRVYLFELGFHSVVIKVPKDDVYADEEIYIVKNLLPKKCNQYPIPLKISKDQVGNNFILMQEANGDLADIVNKLEERLILKIILEVAKMSKCYLEKGIIYNDLKLENILYRCKDNNMELFFGDLGSFCEEGEFGEGATYGAPETFDEYKVSQNTFLFSFGCFIASLYRDVGILAWDDKKSFNKKNFCEKLYPKFRREIERDETIPNNIKLLIFSFTELNPKIRQKYSLDLVFEIINYRS